MGYTEQFMFVYGINVLPYIHVAYNGKRQTNEWWLQNKDSPEFGDIKIPLYMGDEEEEWLSPVPYDDDDEHFNEKHAQIQVSKNGFTGHVMSAAYVIGESSPALDFSDTTLGTTFSVSDFSLGGVHDSPALLEDARTTLAKIGLQDLPLGVVMLYGRT